MQSDEVGRVLSSHKVLVDTCFVMHPNFSRFLNEYEDTLKSNHLLVPVRVVQELERIKKKGDHRKTAATRANTYISTAIKSGLAELRGEASDDNKLADNVISRVVEQHMTSHDLVVLTNDRGLRDWLYAKLNSGCFSTRRSLIVIRFGPQSGNPHVWGKPKPSNGRPSPPRTSCGNSQRNKTSFNRPQPFGVSKAVAPDIDKALQVTEDVISSKTVFTYSGKAVHLRSQLGKGGEGDVFETDSPGVLCKLYHDDKLTVGKQKKIELMTTRKVSHQGICWPTEAVKDSQGVFRGFLMPKAVGEPLGHGLFIPTVWMKTHPDWTRVESVRLAINVLEGIQYLHRMKVLLGDINPMNILVKDENNVYFVDCDSFQVDGFPCPVGSENFVAPEIQGKDFRHFLRTSEHEEFAVASLIFMMMMPGKPPYSHQGGADGATNIRKMHFPYPLGEKSSSGAPEGAWRFCWSHLTRRIKELFHQTFHVDYRDQNRPSLTDWLRAFKDYERILHKPDAAFHGPKPQFGFDLSILPQNYRYVDGKNTLPTGGDTDLQRSVRRMAAASRSAQTSTAVRSASTRQHQTSQARPQTPSSPKPQRATSKRPTQSPSPAASGHQQPAPTAEWFLHPLVWPLMAQLKAVAAIALAGTAGSLMFAIGFAFLCLVGGAVFNGDGYGGLQYGFRWGAIVGMFLGVSVGCFSESSAVMETDEAIPWAAGIGGVIGAVAIAFLFRNAWSAIPGAWVGMTVGLSVWRAQTANGAAKQYLEKWYWT